MIYEDYIRAWQHYAPWPLLRQVEQDLIISRALVALYQNKVIAEGLAFRGGTALHKLFIEAPARYSEDLDFVQINRGPIGSIFSAIKEVLDPWLGEPKWAKKQCRVTLYYKFLPEQESFPMKLKLEINTAEHFCVYGFESRFYEVQSKWFSGGAAICTYSLEELIGTKLRALYQRKKGRDLFDLWLVMQNQINLEKVIFAFNQYLAYENKKVTRAQFESNLFQKLKDTAFRKDMDLLVNTRDSWKIDEAAELIRNRIAPLLSGEGWKGLSPC